MRRELIIQEFSPQRTQRTQRDGTERVQVPDVRGVLPHQSREARQVPDIPLRVGQFRLRRSLSGTGTIKGHIHGYIQQDINPDFKPTEFGRLREECGLNMFATRKDLARETGLSVRGVEWNLRKLTQVGIIRRVGPDKGGHWEVTTSNLPTSGRLATVLPSTSTDIPLPRR